MFDINLKQSLIIVSTELIVDGNEIRKSLKKGIAAMKLDIGKFYVKEFKHGGSWTDETVRKKGKGRRDISLRLHSGRRAAYIDLKNMRALRRNEDRWN